MPVTPEPLPPPDAPRGWRLALLLAAYPPAWMLLEALSSPMAFWPVVLRFLLVWWLPARLWPWVAAVDITAALLARQIFQGEPFALGPLLISIAPVLIYMAMVALVRGREPIHEPDHPRRMAQLVVACTLSAFAVAPVLATYLGRLDGDGTANLDALLGFGFGDLFGLMVGVPLLVALRANGLGLWRSWRWLADGAIGLAACIALMAVARQHPALHEHLLLLAMLPTVVLAFRHGWVGAAWSVSILGLLLALGIGGEDDRLRQQVMGSVIGGSALLLGAAVSHLRAQRDTVEAQHASLRLAMLEQRELAARIVAMEDDGQRHVAESLHQQVAPPLQELRTLLSMAWRSGAAERDARLLETLRGHTWQVQDGLERALRRLQPPSLADADLGETLANGPLWDWAREHGASWTVTTEGPLRSLPERWKSTLYRMAQTGLEQCLQSGGRGFTLRIAVAPRPAGVDIDWTLDVDGTAASGSPRPGEVLNGVHDRALAAGGHYRCEVREGGWRHRVRFEGIPVVPA